MKRGFTLIELLIVMAIAGILLAVAIPAFTKYADKQKSEEQEQPVENQESDSGEIVE